MQRSLYRFNVSSFDVHKSAYRAGRLKDRFGQIVHRFDAHPRQLAGQTILLLVHSEYQIVFRAGSAP